MSNSDQLPESQHIQKLLRTHRGNLYALEEKEAKYGINLPAEIANALQDEKERIRQLEARLHDLRLGPEVAAGFDLSRLRSIVCSASRYIANQQRMPGVWLRSDLFPTARTLFALLVFSSSIPSEVLRRSAGWIGASLTVPGEKPDAVAVGILALIEARKTIGAEHCPRDAVELILGQQNPDGSWEGRYQLPRYLGASTAYCIQALRAYMAEYGSNSACTAACYRGARYLSRYFRLLDPVDCQHSEITNIVEALMLPHYEAWGLIDHIPEIRRATRMSGQERSRFQSSANVKSVAGVLSLLLTEWRDFDEAAIGELLSWLLKNRNRDGGWTEHLGEASEPHHTAMIALPIRQVERLGDHYIPLDVSDSWSLPIESHLDREHSAGAVLVRRVLGEAETILLRRHDGTWVLPKGHIQEGETAAQAAHREIREETGISEVSILSKLGEFRYLFRPGDGVVDKKVTYFLASTAQAGMQLIPDPDHLEARWFALSDIPLLPIYYDDARQALERARLLV